MQDGRAIANFVLDQADAAGVTITHLQLQKIVYFCHVWTLIERGQPLVRHSFEAWQIGPVLQYLYREFKGFRAAPITGRARRIDPSTGNREIVPYSFDAATQGLLTRVVGFYSHLSAGLLVEMTHADGGPWHKVWHHGGKINPGMKIDNRDIKLFYARLPRRLTVQ